MRESYDHETGNQYFDRSNGHCFRRARWIRPKINISDGPGGAATSVRNPQRRLKIFQGVTASVVDYLDGRGVCWKIRASLAVWWRIRLILDGYWGVATLVGEDHCRLEIIEATYQRTQRATEVGRNYCPGADACCGYLVRLHIGLGYLGRHQCWLMTSMPPIRVTGCTCLVEG